MSCAVPTKLLDEVHWQAEVDHVPQEPERHRPHHQVHHCRAHARRGRSGETGQHPDKGQREQDVGSGGAQRTSQGPGMSPGLPLSDCLRRTGRVDDSPLIDQHCLQYSRDLRFAQAAVAEKKS